MHCIYLVGVSHKFVVVLPSDEANSPEFWGAAGFAKDPAFIDAKIFAGELSFGGGDAELFWNALGDSEEKAAASVVL